MNVFRAFLSVAGMGAMVLALNAADKADFPSEICGRRVETFSKIYGAELGYPKPVREIYLLQHPTDGGGKGRALQVVLHSSGHDAKRALLCTEKAGDHDIYRAPDDFYALYLNCTFAYGTDWWWGSKSYDGFELSPCEKRVLATIEEIVVKYGIDRERIYLCGNSMGGSGVLGIGLRHGNVFAAIKANVPALIKHAIQRMGWDTNRNANAEGANIAALPDPPMLIDYSAPDDKWSAGREHIVSMMETRKYPWMLFWGAYGHANSDAVMLAKNDQIHSFEWRNIRKSDLLPVFTGASSDNSIPWPDRLGNAQPGQINAFFRWSNSAVSKDEVALDLFLADVKSRHFRVPQRVTADVTLRRLGEFKIACGDSFAWTYAGRSGNVTIGADGLLTIPDLGITQKKQRLTVRPQIGCRVRLGGALGHRFDLTVTNNLLMLDLEKDFFAPFIERNRSGGFIGLGKHAESAVRFAWHSGGARVVAHKEKVLGFLADRQEADGYTGCFDKNSRMRKLWDLHEMGFIIQAFVADWELFGNRRSLEAARRNVEYVMRNWKSMPDNWEFNRITDRETTLGLGYGIARLYAAIGDERYRKFLRCERSLDDWNDPIVIGRDKMIYGQAYGYLGTCLEQLELYMYDPRTRYLETSFRALDFMLNGDGLLVNGSGGIAECWSDDQDGEGAVGETCNVAFELMFWDKLLRLGVADRAVLGDLMERAIYNALFAAQSADGRKLRYYTPLNGVRTYWPNDIYCCPNNFRRAVARLPEYVFYAREAELLANLYTDCTADVNLGVTRLKVREETDYPESGRVKFTFEPEKDECFSFKLRVPRWCRKPTVKINGCEVVYKYNGGSLLNLPRVWRKGDTVELDFLMEVRSVRGRKRQSGRFAVMRGPRVYALDTRAVEAFKDMHPYDAQTKLSMDPKRLVYRDGAIETYISTVEWAVGIADETVDDGKLPDNVCKVRLVPFECEDCTLTYFRSPDIKANVIEDDELFASPICGKSF